MEESQLNIESLVTFAILMENNEGIIGKSPDYIKEKFDTCMGTNNPEYLERILDSPNLCKLQQWRERWTQ